MVFRAYSFEHAPRIDTQPAMQPNVLPISTAAEEKNCGRNTIYRAVEDGRLNTAEVGKRDMILRDEKYRAFTPKNTGFRRQRDE